MILLASSSEDVFAGWKRGLSDFAPILCVTRLGALKEKLAEGRPQTLLVDHDFLGLDAPACITDLMKLSQGIKIIILSRTLSDEEEWGLFTAGVRGCCSRNIEPKQLKNVVMAVQQGELWIRRTLTCRLLDELGVIIREKNKIRQAADNMLVNLTQREHEIATLVGGGESNKQIALRLSITERTVKAHLTEIFRKLDVADRLKLALIVNGSIRTGG